MSRISNRTRFLFGAAIGAWLNIWPYMITMKLFNNPWGSFIFAYILVFAALWSGSIGDFVEKDKK